MNADKTMNNGKQSETSQKNKPEQEKYSDKKQSHPIQDSPQLPHLPMA